LKVPGTLLIVTGDGLLSTGNQSTKVEKGDAEVMESFEVTGLDDTLDPLTIVNAKSDKVSIGQQVASLEWHPEHRFKATFEAIAGDTNVTSQSPPKRTYMDVTSPLKHRKMARTSNETRGHMTTCYNYPTEKWVSAEGIYIDHGAYSGHHVNTTTQEIEC